MADQIKRHPLNTDFEWRLTQSEGGLSERQRSEFDELGYIRYEQAFDAEQVNDAIEAIDPFEEKVEAFLQRQENGRAFIARSGEITFSAHLVSQSPALRKLSQSEPILDLCLALIGPDVRLYWDQAVYKKPGNPREFPFHQDNGYTYIEPQQYLTCWVALTDTDEENGCPWVLPGWHRYGTLEHESTALGFRCVDTSEDAVAVPAKAGDIVVFSSLTPHRTGPNLTNQIRKAYILQYAPDGARCITNDSDAAILQNDPDRQYLILKHGKSVLNTSQR